MSGLSGMTGFARVDGAHGAWSWAVEARSVNGRTLEVRFKGPAGFDGLEKLARDAAQARLGRGHVSVGLQAKSAEAGAKLSVDTAALERLLSLANSYAEQGRARKPSVEGLLGVRGVMEAVEEAESPEARAEVERAMAASVGVAIEALREARREEGAALAPVLAGAVARVEGLVAAASAEADGQPDLLKARLAARMAELIGEGAPHLEERIVVEAAAQAVRADVREELDRLRAHVEAARTLLGEGAGVGRRLDFLMQEFMREANTLCSKSATTRLTAIGLELKAVIEQLREQVQNVE